MKKCPFCAEEIQDAATFCRHCQKQVGPDAKTLATGIGCLTILVLLAVGWMLTPSPTFAPAHRSTVGAKPRPPGYVSRSDFGDKWPLTVEDGVLICDQTRSALGAVVFKVGGIDYGVNGTSKSLGYKPVDPIWRFNEEPLAPYTPVARVPLVTRQRIFAEIVRCQDVGKGDGSDEACKAAARKKHQLTGTEVNRISVEGASVGWPPLTRTRINIGPLIDAGLKLCTR